ncbi:glycosyltransferase family 25 protein [Thaumasiovibrio sp. DFM-14]|uniref:glycosyltransferase family 25 protein n=1 Tax=Thaumasiovibrio sp. DFM-14 TaxID=3384792 RepID=UPI0039A157CB
MKAFIISLESKIERYEWTYNQLKSIKNLDTNKLLAVNAKSSIKHPLMDRYREDSFYKLNGRHAVLGEIGCYCSHYLAWEKCVELNEPIIIFEDDVVVDNELFNATVENAHKHINDCGYIRLENYSKKRECNYPVEKLDSRQRLIRHIKTPLCMTAYAITPEVAKRFITKSKTFDYPVDVFMRNVWIHQKPTYGITPAGLTGGKFDSAIGVRNFKEEKPLTIRVVKFLSKARDVILNGLFNITSGIFIKRSRPSFK